MPGFLPSSPQKGISLQSSLCHKNRPTLREQCVKNTLNIFFLSKEVAASFKKRQMKSLHSSPFSLVPFQFILALWQLPFPTLLLFKILPLPPASCQSSTFSLWLLFNVFVHTLDHRLYPTSLFIFFPLDCAYRLLSYWNTMEKDHSWLWLWYLCYRYRNSLLKDKRGMRVFGFAHCPAEYFNTFTTSTY